MNFFNGRKQKKKKGGQIKKYRLLGILLKVNPDRLIIILLVIQFLLEDNVIAFRIKFDIKKLFKEKGSITIFGNLSN